MTQYLQCPDFVMKKEYFLPVRLLSCGNAAKTDELFAEKRAGVSFRTDNCALLQGKGAFLLLDFGKELCGGLRIITRLAPENAKLRITFGESVSEACSNIGEKGACNDHSPRDMTVAISMMSDLEFGQTGFRFARIELLTEGELGLISVYGYCLTPDFPSEASIVTNDPLLNQIIDTAAYTLKLTFQNGYIWDGIKRDRLVWCGDLHPEILTSLYWFGNTPNVKNSLQFLRENTPEGTWVNTIPTYSAWWVINAIDYADITGDDAFLRESESYIESVLDAFDCCVAEDGTMHFGEKLDMEFYLDWPTFETADAVVGSASLLILAAKKYLNKKQHAGAENLIRKLSCYLQQPVSHKQIRAFQILAGGDSTGAVEYLQKNGAEGMSTFMAYYILSAAAASGGTMMLPMLKDYYGAMLQRGATTFWEDFDLAWLNGSSRIDAMPAAGEKDLHGDYGKYCYQGFRHSLCHGWAAGVLAFVVEHIAGLKITDGGKCITVQPHMDGLTDLDAVFPTAAGTVEIHIHGGKQEISLPQQEM